MSKDVFGALQLELFIIAVVVLTKPMGLYLLRVLDPNGKTFLDPVIKPAERVLYRLLGANPQIEQDWQQYTRSLLAFSLIACLFTYAVLRLQNVLPLNPQAFGPIRHDLGFNTAVSFATNTNWQSYSGERTLSYFSQMVGLAFQNFVSAAVGIAVAAALVRGIAGQARRTIGNFWADLVRINLYLLVPLCFIYAVFLVSQGTIQNFKPYERVGLIEPFIAETRANESEGSEVQGGTATAAVERRWIETQTIVQGPMASQVAIKMLGTNGGGYTNANAAHPYENPNPLSNFLQMLSILLIPSGLTYYLGSMVKHRRHGWTIWFSMAALFLIGVFVCWWAETAGNPRIHALGVDPLGGNMEGKEVRFGTFNSALFAAITTAASCGAVNAMHDSFTPLGGMVPLINIQLGEVVFGGVGSGLYGMLVFVVLTVFLAGLMIGRTPEYLGKKIEAKDVKLAVLFVMVPVFCILGFTAWSAISSWGPGGVTNGGPHGFSQLLYAFSSAAGNNGSAFAGLDTNAPWFNVTLALAMLLGRFFMIVPVLALAGNLAAKKALPVGAGSFPVSGPTFLVLLAGAVLVVGALTFFPALSLGPLMEHFMMTRSSVLF